MVIILMTHGIRKTFHTKLHWLHSLCKRQCHKPCAGGWTQTSSWMIDSSVWYLPRIPFTASLTHVSYHLYTCIMCLYVYIYMCVYVSLCITFDGQVKYVSSVKSLVFPLPFHSNFSEPKRTAPACLHPSRTLTPEATGQADTITEANPPGETRRQSWRIKSSWNISPTSKFLIFVALWWNTIPFGEVVWHHCKSLKSMCKIFGREKALMLWQLGLYNFKPTRKESRYLVAIFEAMIQWSVFW